jgi:hypothetical protein
MSTDPVTEPTVFTIGTDGITSLRRSQTYTREGGRNSYVMYVNGSTLGVSQFLLLEEGGKILLETGEALLLEEGSSSSGGLSITATPQIAAGTQGNILTLIGTSDTNYVILKAGHGTDLAEDMQLKRGCTITLVFNATSSLWCETSRLLGGVV